MNKTSNYNLNQWERDDRVLMEDFNEDNAKIDGALAGKAEAAALAALQTVVDTKGNCRILAGSYEGTGTYGHTLTLGVLPKLLIVSGGVMHAVFVYGQTQSSSVTYSNGGYSINITWREDGLSWSSRSSANGFDVEGYTYNYVAFY